MNEKKWRACAVVAVTILTLLLLGIGIAFILNGKSMTNESPGHEFSGLMIFWGILFLSAGSFLCFVATAVFSSFSLAAIVSWMLERHGVRK